MSSAVSLYSLSNQNQNIHKNNNQQTSQGSFSEKITELNREIRLEYIKLAEQAAQRPPAKSPSPEDSEKKKGSTPTND